jgi:multidrug transporter EmrE-like cation transporter|tara:strand:+ start:301 stop:660 length:360 start_codon:yes stop_codon:yes gene_type:complete
MSKLLTAVCLLVFSNILAWWQLNAQFTDRFKGHWFWSSGEWMAIFGIPIGYLFFQSTRLSYDHFGFTWNIRMIGFGIGTIVFGLMSYYFLKEIPTLKTIICLLLALAIILIQFTNVVGE